MNFKGTNYKKSTTSEMFGLVKNENEKIVIVVGNTQAIGKEFDNFDDAEIYIASRPYELIINTILIAQHYEEQNKKEMERPSKEVQ